MATLLLAAVYLGERTKLRLLHQYILRCSKRVFGVLRLRVSTVTYGIKQLLFSSHRGLGATILQPGSQILFLPFGF